MWAAAGGEELPWANDQRVAAITDAQVAHQCQLHCFNHTINAAHAHKRSSHEFIWTVVTVWMEIYQSIGFIINARLFNATRLPVYEAVICMCYSLGKCWGLFFYDFAYATGCINELMHTFYSLSCLFYQCYMAAWRFYSFMKTLP